MPEPRSSRADEAAEIVSRIIHARRARTGLFRPELFSDPAWDMLLDLYAAELSQVRVSVTSLCIASNAPTSTALRWISTLERENLIEKWGGGRGRGRRGRAGLFGAPPS